MKIGKRGFGETQAGFHLEMNADAVRRLLGKLDSAEGKAELYEGMAEAFALQHNLPENPTWPVSRLDDDGVLATLSRNLLPLSKADNAFLEARATLRALDEAHKEDDPVQSAKILAQGMAFLRHEVGMAAALVRGARGEDDDPGVEIEVLRPHIAALEAEAPEPPDAAPERA